MAVISVIGSAGASGFGEQASGLPSDRLPTLRRLLKESQRPLRILETHSGLTGLIAEHARGEGGEAFDGMWSSSLTASAAKGKPDIETVDTTEDQGRQSVGDVRAQHDGCLYTGVHNGACTGAPGGPRHRDDGI